MSDFQDSAFAASADAVVRTMGRGDAVALAVRERATALAGVKHPGVCVPTRVEVDAHGHVQVWLPRVPGMDVAEVLRRRGSLAAGECVALGVGIADALAALHDSGLAHGDVSPANVMVDGLRVVLVDTVAGALAGEAGTPPYAAPERRAGPSAPSDVYALATLLIEAADAHARPAVEAWMAPALALNALDRPSALVVGSALRHLAPPTPVAVPSADAGRAMREAATQPRERTVLAPSAQTWRAYRVARRWLPRVAIAIAVAVVLAVAVGAATATPPPSYERTPDATVRVDVTPAASPAAAAQALTERRIGAVAAGDGAALLATMSPTGSAYLQSEHLAAQLSAQTVSYSGLSVEVNQVQVLSGAGSDATVRVEYALSAHSEAIDGAVTARDGYTQVVDLDITWADGKWLVVRARLVS